MTISSPYSPSHMPPLTREDWHTVPGLAVVQATLQEALAGWVLAQGLFLATCLLQPGPPAGTQTCPGSANQRATCKDETEAGCGEEASVSR